MRLTRPTEATVPGTAGYGDEASELAQRYESVRFEDVHRDVLHLFPSQPSPVLDIGAGSGRDAAALARRGHSVMAVEPTVPLRLEAQRIHTKLPIEWVDDALPLLPVVSAYGRSFHLILLAAVWMHLDGEERAGGMKTIASLLAKGGTVFSLRRGPIPARRRMFDVSADETIALARDAGLVERYRGTRRDAQGRADVTWSVVAMRAAAS